MLKTYKFRIYPNDEQKIIFAKTFGSVRFIYNHILADAINQYKNTGKSKLKTPAYFKNIENYKWLKEIDSLALCNAQLHVRAAYKNFFENKNKKPKFKKKGYDDSYTTNNQNGTVKFEYDLNNKNNYIKLPKIKTYIKIKVHRKFDGLIKSVTISRKPSGKYYISILVETDEPIKQFTKTNKKIGLDFGFHNFLVDNNGNKYLSIDFKQYEKKLELLHQKLSNKVKGSKNRNKIRIKLTKLYEHIENKKDDFLHKLTHLLVKENDVIVIEDLSVNEMLVDKTDGFTNKEKHKINKKLLNLSFYKFKTMLEYKCQRYNKKLIIADKYYKSSQTCNVCSNINPKIKDLSIRLWLCPNCNTFHDRDINAAKNLVKLAI